MNMKKTLVIIGLAIFFGIAAMQQVSARGWGSGEGGGYNCPKAGMGYQQLDQATKEKIDAFRAENLELRKQMAMKKAEKQALLSHQNPDPKALAKVEGELFDLRTEMQKRRAEAGIDKMGMGYRGGYGKRGGGNMQPGGNSQDLTQQ